MEEILDPIHNYLFSQDPDFSLMINGEWGSGKSYFIEKILKPKYKDDFNFIYCSAYSIDSTEDLVRQISVQKNPVLRAINNSKALRIGTSLASGLLRFALPMIKVGTDIGKESDVQVNAGSAGQGSIDLSDFWSFTEKDVLIIDDIERSRLKTNEIFGFLYSSFLNPRACKVILVCSESELIKKDKKYLEQKEKIVRHTIPFEWNCEEVIPSMIESTVYNREYKDFLLSNCQPFLIQGLEIIDGKNLRKFSFFLSNIDQLSKYVSIGDFEMSHKSLMQTMFVLSLEYIEGNLNNLNTYHQVLMNDLFRDSFSTSPNGRHRYEPLLDIYNKRFIHSEEVLNLIVRGFVTEEYVKDDINQFILVDNPENDWTKVADLLSRFEKLSGEEFDLYYKKSLEYLAQNKFSNYELCDLGITYVRLLKNGITSDYISVDDIDNTLIKHFKESSEISEFKRNFHPTDISPDFSESLPKLHKAVSDYHTNLKRERFHQIHLNYFDGIKSKEQPIIIEALEDILNNCDERMIDILIDIYINNFPLAERINRTLMQINITENRGFEVLTKTLDELGKHYGVKQASLGMFHFNNFKTIITELKEMSVNNKR